MIGKIIGYKAYYQIKYREIRSKKKVAGF